jgi:hypothetical protein
MKSISIPVFAGLIALALCGCGESQPDYSPIGDGMTAIGICLVVAAVVKALADLVIAGEKESKEQPPPKPRKMRGAGPKGGDE